MFINKNFTLLLSGQLVSQVGDKFHTIALSLWVLAEYGSTARMGAVLAASLVPSLILGLFSGSFIDRYHRKVIIVGTDVIRGLVLALFAWLFYSGSISFGLVLLLQAVLSVNAAFFDPAVPSVIPQIVGEKDLGRANAMHQFVNGSAMVGGAVLGGVCVAAFGFLWVFLLNGISFLISAGFEAFIAIPRIAAEKRNSLWRDVCEGYGYVFRDPLLKVVLFMVMVIHFFVGAVEVMMPVVANELAGDGARALGFYQGAFGGGTILAGFILSLFTWSGREKRLLFGGVFCMGLVYCGAGFLPAGAGVWGFVPAWLLFGIFLMTAGISFRTLLARQTEEAFSGRVFALAGSLGNASIPGAMMVYGVLLETFHFKGLLLVSGLVLMALGLMSYGVVRERRDGGEGAGSHRPGQPQA